MIKVLVTGASSSLGANVILTLLEKGYAVRAFARKSSNLFTVKGLDIETFFGNISNSNDIHDAISGCDYVIHAAANMELSPKITGHQKEDNVKAVEHLVNSCLEHNVKRLVYVSTANTIGPGTKARPGTEENQINGQFERSGYAKSKLLAQQLLQKHVREDGLDAIIVNPSFMIGPYDHKPTSGRMVIRFYNKKINLIPPGGKSFIYVKDVAEAVCNALTLGRPGECYLLTNQNLTYLEFCNKMDELTQNKSIKIHVPRLLMMLFGYTGSFLGILGIKTDLNRVNIGMLCSTAFYSSAKAQKELDLKLTPVDEALRKAIDWFRENGYI